MIRKIPLSSPDIGEEEESEILKVIKSSVLSIGPNVRIFEEKVAKYTGTKYAVAVNSGTSALSIIMNFLNPPKNEKIITTSFSFVTSANIILYNECIPIFADIEPDTYNISPDSISEQLEKNGDEKIKGIIGVDVFGQPCDWDEIEDIAQANDLFLIEDSCEAIGSEYKGRKCGTFGVSGCFAFYPNKQMTTGEGGIIVTNDDRLNEFARSIRNQGRGIEENWLEHVRLGYNFRMDELSATLGMVQIGKLDSFIDKRRSVADNYEKLLAGIEGVKTLTIRKSTTKMSYFVYVILLDEKIDRDGVIDYLGNMGVGCRNYFSPIHLQPFYRERFGFKSGMLPVTENVASRSLAIPFHNNLSPDDQEYVVAMLKKAIECNS